MKAIVKEDYKSGGIYKEIAKPTMVKGDVLIKVSAAALCKSDLDVYYNKPSFTAQNLNMPFVMGHEFCGVIEEISEGVTGFAVGDLVAAETHLPCGECPICKTDKIHICENGMQILGRQHDGCFAQYIAMPASSCVKMPIGFNPVWGAIMEPLGVAIHALQEAQVAGKSVAIIGTGTIGTMAIESAKAMGAKRVISITSSEDKIKTAMSVGADCGIDHTKEDVLKRVKELNDGLLVDCIIEMTGSNKILNMAIDIVAVGGVIVGVGVYNEDVQIPRYTARVMYREIKLTGIWGRRMFSTWDIAKELVQGGKINMEKYVGKVMPLSQFDEGVERFKDVFGRIVFIPED